MQKGHLLLDPTTAICGLILVAFTCGLLASCVPPADRASPSRIDYLDDAALKVLWAIEFGSAELPWNMEVFNGALIVYVGGRGSEGLVALEPNSGNRLWTAELAFTEAGDVALAADANTLVGASGTVAYAVDSNGGVRRWTQQLGDGHVASVPQVDGSIVRVYYGDEIIEISVLDGLILGRRAMLDSVWVVGELELQQPKPGRLVGIRQSAASPDWDTSHVPLQVKSIWKLPQAIGINDLVAAIQNNGFCRLNLADGTDDWCLEGRFISNLAMDRQRNNGYVLTNDFSMLSFDLDTGAITTETHIFRAMPDSSRAKETHRYLVSALDGNVYVMFSDSRELVALRLGE